MTMNLIEESNARRSMPFEMDPITRAPSSADQTEPRPPLVLRRGAQLMGGTALGSAAGH